MVHNIVAENIGLEVLDLSWNHFRGRDGVELVDGIKVRDQDALCMFTVSVVGIELLQGHYKTIGTTLDATEQTM